jgi:alpha-glucosidase
VTRAWWREAVFYQIYPRSFSDANGDGIGDLRGIIDRLDYLAGTPNSLGVDAIWLSPFYVSPMADFGYDVADHCDVDPLFGTLDDFDELIEASHRRNLRVIIDLIPNHTSDQHPWFQQSRASRTSPYRNWYVWRPSGHLRSADASGGDSNGVPPNNWMAEFGGGPAWTLDPGTREWYLHSFLPSQPDLNWDEPAVEAAMRETMRFWLRRGVDGFRADVIHKIGKAPDLRDNLGMFVGPGPNDRGRRFDEDWPSVHQRIRSMRRVLRSAGDRMMVGEVYVLDPEQLAPYVRSGRELDLAHNFHFLTLPWDADAFREAIAALEELLRPRGWPTWCLNNHDHSRVASRYPGEAAARLAGMMILTLRGTPFLFQGEELGLADGVIPPASVVDPAGRDPERTPMPWDRPSSAGAGAGFTNGRPWLPVSPDAEQHNVATEATDTTSVLAMYRSLLALRRSRRALRAGEMTLLSTRDRDVLAWRRVDREASFVIALNFADRPASIGAEELGAEIDGIVEVSASMQRAGERVRGPQLGLDPLDGVVLREC